MSTHKARSWAGVIVGLFLLGSSGCTNLFMDMADQGTDEARLYQAKLLINQHLYSDAIDQILGMTSAGQRLEAAQVTLASAYAGRCGLDALTLVQNLSNSSGNILSILLAGFSNSSASKVADCKSARSILASLSSPTVDEDLLMVLVAFSTIGAEMNVDYDTDHDDQPDAGVGWCETAQVLYPRPAPSPMSDADVVDVFVNIAYAINALTAAGSTIAGSSVDAITTLCATLPDPTVCNRTDPTAYTAPEILALRGVIASQDGIGLGICPDTVTNCVCL